MRSFNVRQFFGVARDKWPCGELELFDLTFDDGVTIQATTPRLELSVKLWGPLLDFPKSPVNHDHYIKAGPVPWRKIEDVSSAINKSILDAYGAWDVDREKVWESIQISIADTFYNECIVEHGKYARGLDAFDLRKVYDYPAIAAERAKVTPTESRPYASPIAIEKATKAIAKILRDDNGLILSPVASGIKSGLVKGENLNQIINIRGFNTEINSTIQKTPIMGDYYAGINDPAEMLMDSSLASKAILFQGDPLKQTEFANRKLQFSTAQVDLLITGDCKSNEYLRIIVTRERAEGLLGMFYVDPNTEALVEFTPVSANTYKDQELMFRTAIMCDYRHKGCVCSTCYGTLATNLPYGTNVGTIASMRTMSAISQLVLKVKHVEGSVVSDPLVISAAEADFITPSSDGASIYLTPYTGSEECYLVIKTAQDQKIINGRRLPVLKESDMGPNVDPSKFTQFREMLFMVKRDDDKVDKFKVTVAHGTRLSFLSETFLRWFVKQNLPLAQDGNYHVNLSTWDFEQPFLKMPNKHTSMKDFAAVYEAFVRSTKEEGSGKLGKIKQLNHYSDMSDALCDLYDLILEKLDVHFTHVSIVATSMLVHANEGGRWTPKLGEPVRFAKHSRIMNEGSLGALFAYHGGALEINEKMAQYLNRDRPQHLLDCMLLPN